MGFFRNLFVKNAKENNCNIYAPIAGQAVPITEVPDPTFAEGLLGNGVAIIPSEGRVFSPVDGVVETMFDTGHAVSLRSDFGAEVLIHVGLETVTLKGKPFTIHVKNGDRIKKGQLLMDVDIDAIQAAGLPSITPVLVCNSDEFSLFKSFTGNRVTNEDIVVELRN